jgi:hypothetical protein
MKVQDFTVSEEHWILAGAALHPGVLDRLVTHLGEESRPFRAPWSNRCWRWCREHWAKYHQPPKEALWTYFQEWAEKNADPDQVELMEQFLNLIKEQSPEELNEDFIVDKAGQYFKRLRLERLHEELGQMVQNGMLAEAEDKVINFQRADLTADTWLNPFDKELVCRALRSEQEEDIVHFPGALGEFFHQQLRRTSFVAFAGPDKRGKSFWLMEMVYRALKSRRRVLYYVLGDMSELEVEERLIARIARRPISPGHIRWPKEIRTVGKERTVMAEDREFKERLSAKEACEALAQFQESIGAKELRLRLKRQGGYIVSASAIESDVREFIRRGWVPDVIVVDYADLLKPEPETNRQDARHQVNRTWIILRRIALDLHCLVVTATQTDAPAYSAHLIGPSNFSEDKRKNAHVTGMIGINQTEAEKWMGLYRLNWVVARRGRHSTSRVVYTASELAVSCPCVISSW